MSGELALESRARLVDLDREMYESRPDNVCARHTESSWHVAPDGSLRSTS